MDIVSSKNPTQIESLADITTYKAGVAQSTAYRLLKKFTEEAISEHDITMMQWFIIGTIYDAGKQGIGVTQLSNAVDTNVPYITNTLNLLEQKHIIERETRSGDSRSKVVRIDPNYIAKIPQIEASLRTKMRSSIYQNVTPDELRIYLIVLHKLASSLDRASD